MHCRGRTYRFFCQDKNGRDLFYIELDYDDEIDFIHFHTSLEFDLFSQDKIVELINRLMEDDFTDSERQKCIEELFENIQSLPGIQSYYFSDEILSKSGKYLEFYASVTSDLIKEKDFDDYTAFSQQVNAFYFDYALPFIQREFAANTPVEIEKNDFEKLLIKDSELTSEYVNLYSPTAQFFRLIIHGDNKNDCFIMTENSEVKMFFIRKCE